MFMYPFCQQQQYPEVIVQSVNIYIYIIVCTHHKPDLAHTVYYRAIVYGCITLCKSS